VAGIPVIDLAVEPKLHLVACAPDLRLHTGADLCLVLYQGDRRTTAALGRWPCLSVGAFRRGHNRSGAHIERSQTIQLATLRTRCRRWAKPAQNLGAPHPWSKSHSAACGRDRD